MMVVLLAAYWVLAVSAAYDKSPTFDEPVHVAGGYSYYLTGDYRLNAEAGVLSQRLAALPLWLGHVEFPTEFQESEKLQHAQASWNVSDQWGLAHLFFYHSHNDPRQMLLWARAFMALMGVAMGALVYFWSRRLFGPAGAMFSLAMFALSPGILANGPLAATDLTSSFCFLLAVGCFWWMLQSLSWVRVLAAGLTLGLLFLSKMSAPIVLPMLLILLVLRVVKGGPLELAVGPWKKVLGSRLGISGALLAAVVLNGAIVLATIWTGYSWRYNAFADGGAAGKLVQEELMDKPGLVQDAARFLGQRRLLPQAYLHGIVFTSENAQKRNAFLNGEHYTDGRVGFFPYAFAVKTPLSGLIALPLSVMAAVGLLKLGREGKAGRQPRAPDPNAPPELPSNNRWIAGALYETAPLWVLMIGYWAIVLASHINIGLRHLLPAYGPMLILIGVCGTWWGSEVRLHRLLVKGVLAVAVLECVLAWPNYLAYFNVIGGGGDNAYKHLGDSSLDWGQDLPGLRDWLIKHREWNGRRPVYLSYFGTGSPTWYGLTSDESEAKLTPAINVRRLPGMFDQDVARQPLDLGPLTGGTYCISATILQGICTTPQGPWVKSYEKSYQELTKRFQSLLGLPEKQRLAIIDQNPAYWGQAAKDFIAFRLGRLCAYLRERKPDANVNYSILIYRLSDAEVSDALGGVPAELREDEDSPYVPHSK